MSEEFDFIVAGAGLAGCLVARRLAGDTAASVLLLCGVEALRVVDASVMPPVTTGSIQAPVLAIAALGADMLAEAAR